MCQLAIVLSFLCAFQADEPAAMVIVAKGSAVRELDQRATILREERRKHNVRLRFDAKNLRQSAIEAC